MVSSLTRREAYATPENMDERLEGWLRNLAGSRGRGPLPSLKSATLFLIDLQHLFLCESSGAFLPAWKGAEERCRVLLQSFRAAGLPVVWTRHANEDGDEGGIVRNFGGRSIQRMDAELADGWIPGDGERVITKSRYSIWTATELEQVLPPDGVAVFAGVTTHRCILSSVVEAASRDRECVVVADACVAQNERLHEAALTVLSGGFAFVASVQEIMRGINAH